jgi:hypothetical protein
VTVTASFHEEGSVLRGDKHGEVDGFAIEFSLDSEETEAAIRDLIRLAHEMCFTEAALKQVVPIRIGHTLNGKPLI